MAAIYHCQSAFTIDMSRVLPFRSKGQWTVVRIYRIGKEAKVISAYKIRRLRQAIHETMTGPLMRMTVCWWPVSLLPVGSSLKMHLFHVMECMLGNVGYAGVGVLPHYTLARLHFSGQ